MSFRVVEEANGRGLQTERCIAAGDVVIELSGRWVVAPSKYTIQLGEGQHLEPEDHQWALINHSCRPNLRVDCERKIMLATRDIALGETLSFNYLSTEWDLAAPFPCLCRAEHCFVTISGARYLTAQQRREHMAWLHASPAVDFESTLMVAV